MSGSLRLSTKDGILSQCGSFVHTDMEEITDLSYMEITDLSNIVTYVHNIHTGDH